MYLNYLYLHDGCEVFYCETKPVSTVGMWVQDLVNAAKLPEWGQDSTNRDSAPTGMLQRQSDVNRGRLVSWTLTLTFLFTLVTTDVSTADSSVHRTLCRLHASAKCVSQLDF